MFLSVCILVNASCLTIYLSFIYKILSRYFELVFQSSAAVSVSGSSLLGSHSHRFHISTLIQGLQHSPQQSWQCIMSGGKVGYLHDSKTRDSAIEARGVSQTTATSPIDNDSQSIKDVYNNSDVSHHEASEEQPLRESATVTASEMSSDDSAASVWWRNELDRLETIERFCNSFQKISPSVFSEFIPVTVCFSVVGKFFFLSIQPRASLLKLPLADSTRVHSTLGTTSAASSETNATLQVRSLLS